MVLILSIDPSSNKIETSTTGVVLMENARLLNYWVVPYGADNFVEFYNKTPIIQGLKVDAVVVEKYEARDNDKSKDNSVLETIAAIQGFSQACFHQDIILQRNTGYKSDIPDNLLKVLGLYRFKKSHHQDVRAAARLALFWAMRNDIEEVIQDIGKVVSEHRNHA